MKIIGLTGGIGSGKTTVSEMFRCLGIPIFIADDEAKALMNSSKVIKRKLVSLLGNQAYDKEGKLARNYVANKVFNDEHLLRSLNTIVHPEVASHFKRWLKKQDSPYIIKEAAIIFEHSKQDEFDYIITVISDRDKRIERIRKRDGKKKSQILKIMATQLSDQEKVKLSDFVINNNSLDSTEKQVMEIHEKLLEICI